MKRTGNRAMGIRRTTAALAVLAIVAMPAAAQQTQVVDPGYTPQTSVSEQTVTGGTQAGTITGRIAPALINVALPTNIEFVVKASQPVKPQPQSALAEVVGPEITIANQGVDLRISVVGIEDQSVAVRGRGPDDKLGTSDDLTYPFRFMDSVAAMQAPQAPRTAAMLALMGSEPAQLSDIETHAITSDKITAAGRVPVAVVPGGGSVKLQVYCAVKSDHKVGGYAFHMVPLLKAEYDKRTNG